MNKSELIAKIAQDTSLNKKQVEDVLKSLALVIKNEVITTKVSEFKNNGNILKYK